MLQFLQVIAVNKDLGINNRVQGSLVASSFDLATAPRIFVPVYNSNPASRPQLDASSEQDEEQIDWDGLAASSEVWAKNMSDGSMAVILLNLDGNNATSIQAKWTDLGLAATASMVVRDLWQKQDLGAHTGSFSATVDPHGVAMIKLTKSK
jgi:hypothetical protein